MTNIIKCYYCLSNVIFEKSFNFCAGMFAAFRELVRLDSLSVKTDLKITNMLSETRRTLPIATRRKV